MKRTHLLIAAVVAGFGLAVGGCGWVGFTPASFKAVSKSSVPAETGKNLSVETDNGSIEVGAWDSKEVLVEATIRATTQERLDKTSVKTVQENGKIIITVSWPEGKRLGNEGADLVVHVPKGDGARLATSNGAIKATGLHGMGKFETSNGAVTITEHDGAIDVETSNGGVKVIQANSSVKVDTSNGAINVSLADSAKGPVDLDSSNGGVTLEVGSAFSGTLTADTSNGSCKFTDKSGNTTKSKSLSHSFGSGPASVIKTSNGSVTVNVGK
jgi:DUF4097 and DUF4098 domain-containing protein YvlB